MKKIVAFIALFIGFQSIVAQPESGFDLNKIVIGGSFGGNFTGEYSSLTIAPQIGYRLTPAFTAGTGIGYYYFSQHEEYSAHYLGLNVYGRYTLFNLIMLQVTPEVNFAMLNYRYSPRETHIVPSFLVGAGLRLDNFYGMLQYDILKNPNSPYQGIVYSVGVIF